MSEPRSVKVNHPCFRHGTRVYLRALTTADIPRWAQWFNAADVTRHMNKGAFPNTEAQQQEIFDRLHRSRNDVQLGIALVENDELVGIIGVHHIDWIHRRGDVSIVIGDGASQGKGVATEVIALMVAHAFERLNLHKVTAGMWATNIGSRRAFEKNGFVLEGTLRESFWQTDLWVDEMRLGLLRADWLKSRAGKNAR